MNNKTPIINKIATITGVFTGVISVIITVMKFIRDTYKIQPTVDGFFEFFDQIKWIIYLLTALFLFYLGYIYGGKRKDKQFEILENDHDDRFLIPKSKILINTINNTIERVDDESKSIISGFFQGWMEQIVTEIEAGGIREFKIDSDYYERCLLYMDSSKLLAVADLTNDIESFWKKDPNPRQTKVAERIFLINWFDFFNEQELFRLTNKFKQHKKIYSIRISHKPDQVNYVSDRFKNMKGLDIFLGEPNVVGGYVVGDEKNFLKIARDDRAYEDAKAFYSKIKNNFSIEFDNNWNSTDLRKKWIEKNRIGSWPPEWKGKVEQRTPDYFVLYDMHIRCWIPYYDKFLEGAFDIIKHHTLNTFRKREGKLKLLEIGYGTGALTEKVLSWINLFERPFMGTNNEVYYYGVDPAKEQMLVNSHYQLPPDLGNRYFFSGNAFDSMPREVSSEAPFDVIFASLVLHDLNTDNPNPNYGNLLDDFSKYVKSGSVIIFADIFKHNDVKVNEKRIIFWKKYMRTNLSDLETETFLKANQDMVNCLSENDAIEIGKSKGFVTEFTAVKNGEFNNPFKYMILIKE